MTSNSPPTTTYKAQTMNPQRSNTGERIHSLKRLRKKNEMLEGDTFAKAYNDAISYALHCEDFVAPEIERKELTAKIDGLYSGRWPRPCQEIAMKGYADPEEGIRFDFCEALRNLQRERDGAKSIVEQDDFEIESVDHDMVWQTEHNVRNLMLSRSTPVCDWIDPLQLLLFAAVILERKRKDFEWTERTMLLASTYGPAIRLEDDKTTMIITPYLCPRTGEREIGDFMIPQELLKPGGAVPRFDTPRGDFLKVRDWYQ